MMYTAPLDISGSRNQLENCALTSIVVHSFSHRANDVLHILIAHAMKHGQTDQPLVGSFRHRIFAAPVTEAFAVVRVSMHRNVMHIDPDVLRAQRLEHLTAVCPQLHSINPNWIEVPGWIDVVANRWRNYLRDLTKRLRI